MVAEIPLTHLWDVPGGVQYQYTLTSLISCCGNQSARDIEVCSVNMDV